MKIPQLRVVLNTTCGKHCCYCRPSGEAACSVCPADTMSTDELVDCIKLLVAGGIREVRLTGGDPAFYPQAELIRLVGALSKLNLNRLSLVTRSDRIQCILPQLKNAGLRYITFSLDSVDAERWVKVCGIGMSRKDEHHLLLETIRTAKNLGFAVNLNSVLLDETCEQDLNGLVAFAKKHSIGLKIEEVIRDIGRNGGNGMALHADLAPLKKALRRMATESEIVSVYGGLGHLMEVLYLAGGASVTWKMFEGGACYGPSCRDCRYFPCDDALMALRLLPNGMLQTCLKREDNLIDLRAAIRNGKGEVSVAYALKEYQMATRLSFEEIKAARNSGQRMRKVA